MPISPLQRPHHNRTYPPSHIVPGLDSLGKCSRFFLLACRSSPLSKRVRRLSHCYYRSDSLRHNIDTCCSLFQYLGLARVSPPARSHVSLVCYVCLNVMPVLRGSKRQSELIRGGNQTAPIKTDSGKPVTVSIHHSESS